MRPACPLRAGDHLSDRRSHDSAQPSAAANGAERTTLQDQEHTQTELSVSHRTSRACGACLCDMCTRGAVVSEHARGAVRRSSLADGGLGLTIQRNQMTHIPRLSHTIVRARDPALASRLHPLSDTCNRLGVVQLAASPTTARVSVRRPRVQYDGALRCPQLHPHAPAAEL